jgi:hypothetical protein
MKLNLGRSIIAAVAAELGTYVVWVAVLLAAGLIFMNPSRTQWFAYSFGQSVGIFSGFVLCIFCARWAAAVSRDAVVSGVIVGVLCAALNALVVAVKVGTFPPILLVGSLGRVLGGVVGGWLAHKRRGRNKPMQATCEDAGAAMRVSPTMRSSRCAKAHAVERER